MWRTLPGTLTPVSAKKRLSPKINHGLSTSTPYYPHLCKVSHETIPYHYPFYRLYLCTPRGRLQFAVRATCGCSGQITGRRTYAQGENAFNSNYFLQAADDFKRAQENYTAAGDKALALKARDMAFLAFGASMDFPYNRSAADAELAAALPGASAAQRAAWLDEAKMATIRRGTRCCTSSTPSTMSGTTTRA